MTARRAPISPGPSSVQRNAEALRPRARRVRRSPGGRAGEGRRPGRRPAGRGAWRRRVILRAAVPAALIAAVFGLALPRVASYRAVWASTDAMTWPYALLVGAAATASMMAYWIVIRAVLPWIGLRQAAAVSLGSNAVAGTLPAGGAVAVGVSWAMLSSWGLSTADYVLYTLVTGIWNLFTLMGLPVLAVLVMATASRPDATMITGAAVGLALLAAMAGGLGLLLHSEASALRASRVLQSGLAIAARLARRAPPASVVGSLPGFRDRARALLAARGWRIAAATVASHLTLWLVLLACLRAVEPVPGSAALADLPGGLLGHPAAHRHTRHPGRPGDHRTRPDRHPGRQRRAQSQRPGDGRRPDVPGRHLSAFHSPRRPRLPHLAVCTRAHQRQSAQARITMTALAGAMRSGPAAGTRGRLPSQIPDRMLSRQSRLAPRLRE